MRKINDTSHTDDVAANAPQPLSDVEIEESNMDALDQYLAQVKEYEEKGYWTGFMGVKIDTPPSEPTFLDYND